MHSLVIQGSSEWAALRAGIPTASKFDKIVTPGGALSKSAGKYMRFLVAERLLGEPIEEFHGHWMDKGSQTEAEAVNFYEYQKNLDTVKVGFITNAAETIGASPDRLVGDVGLLEIKCPIAEIHMAYLLEDGSPYEEYRVQVQGQLWIAQREWADAVSYYAGLPYALGRTERNEGFIEILRNEIGEFCVRLEALYAKCVERGYAKKRPERKVSTQQSAVDLMRECMGEVNRK